MATISSTEQEKNQLHYHQLISIPLQLALLVPMGLAVWAIVWLVNDMPRAGVWAFAEALATVVLVAAVCLCFYVLCASIGALRQTNKRLHVLKRHSHLHVVE